MRYAAWVFAALGLASTAAAEPELPVLRATRPVVSVRVAGVLSRDSWQLAPGMRPDVFDVPLPDGRPARVVFLSDVDSLGFDVEAGRPVDFVIEHGSDRCWTRIVGFRPTPAAVFGPAYRAAHRGRIECLVPEVYELVNIAIAMTGRGIADSNLVFHGSEYYRDVRAWFEPFRGHPALAAIDSALRSSQARYFHLKMNGYAFEFGRNGRIVQSPVYDRTSFRGETVNSLRPFVPLLQAFSDTSRFREFYRRHRGTYARQAAFFADTAGLEPMLGWLRRQFPGQRPYDSFKVVFSPLVAYNQSATWLESDGFRELQAHVNFPYPRDLDRMSGGTRLSKAGETLLRSTIVFTELNHGFINPEADRCEERVLRATSRRDLWVDSARGADYYPGISAFNEYMNWALVSLRAVDLAPRDEQAALVGMVDRMMTRRRGFPQFEAFDAFLVDLYRNRPQGRTIADLYPRIVEWCERRNAAGGP